MPNSTQLIEANKNNLMDYGRFLGRLPGSAIQKQDGFLSMCLKIPYSELNWTVNTHPTGQEVEQKVRSMVQFYKALNMPFCLWSLLDPPEAALEQSLVSNGLKFVYQSPCMAANLDEINQYPRDERLQLRVVSDEKTLRLWGKTSFTGFELPEAVETSYLKFVMPIESGPQAPQKLYVAEMNNEPVGTALLYNSAGVSGIYFVSVVPEHRRKGFGLAITQQLKIEARKDGYNICILQSSLMGVKVYKKAGFRTVCTANVYSNV